MSVRTKRAAWAEVDLDALAHNIREVRRLISKDSKILAVVKADAYGHGAVTSSKIFLENGASMFGVARINEALELRDAGLNTPILNLGFTPEEQYEILIKKGIIATIYNLNQALTLEKIASQIGLKAVIHIKIDSGMNRIGFQPNDDTIMAITRISALPHIELEGIFTHFAVSDIVDKTYTNRQFELFQWVLDELRERRVEPRIKHVSNSAAIIDLPEYSLDMVRPGLMLYGYEPSDEVDLSRVSLKPAMALKASLSNVKAVSEGMGISYGLTYKTKRPSIIGTISIGYADGYRRALSNRGFVDINGEAAPIVGRICMDQCMIDLTDVDRAEIGDEVTLFGGGCAPSVEEMAGMLDTIPDEVTSSITRRVPRIYLKSGKVTEIRDYLER